MRSLAHHYTTFWGERHRPNMALFHFEDYRSDLPAAIRRLAAHLDIAISQERSVELAAEASIERARSRATDIAPEAHMGVWKDPARFFRSGTSGEWRRVMTPAQQERYATRLATLVPPDLADWIHRGSG